MQNISSLGNASLAPRRNPATLDPTLYLLSNSGVVPGTGVAQWNDIGRRANNAAEGTGSNQPLLTANVFGALPGVTYDGTTKRLTIPHSATFNTGTGGFLVSCLYKTPAAWWVTQIYRALFDKSAGTAWASASDALGIGLAVGNDSRVVAVSAGLNTLRVQTAAVLANSTKYVLSYAYDGIGTHTVRINGKVAATVSAATATNNNTNALGIGFNPTLTTRFLQGDLGAVVFLGRALGAPQIQAIDRYLMLQGGVLGF